jgi:hypothetical protein
MAESVQEVSKKVMEYIEYVNWDANLVILIDSYSKWKCLGQAIHKSLR